jgi:hypothetical protein
MWSRGPRCVRYAASSAPVAELFSVRDAVRERHMVDGGAHVSRSFRDAIPAPPTSFLYVPFGDRH